MIRLSTLLGEKRWPQCSCRLPLTLTNRRYPSLTSRETCPLTRAATAGK